MSTAAPAKEEVSFYSDDEGVRVTSTRLIVESTTFAMGNITSVSRTIETPDRRGPIVMGAIGIICFLIGASDRNGGGTLMFGALLLSAAALWWKGQKTIYGLRLASSSGERTPITSVNKDRVDKIVQAVNEAIIGRG